MPGINNIYKEDSEIFHKGSGHGSKSCLRARNDKEMKARFEEKVHVIADEVLGVLKELHQDHKELINSSLIASKMSCNEAIRKILLEYETDNADSNMKANPLIEAVDSALTSITELVPESLLRKNDIEKTDSSNRNSSKDETKRINAEAKTIRDYIFSISGRSRELERLLQKTVEYLVAVETYCAGETVAAHGNFHEKRIREKDVFSNIGDIRKTFDASSDIATIQKVVLGKLDNIAKSMEEKSAQDILRLQETEETLGKMSTQMNALVSQAEAMTKRSMEAEHESFHDSLTTIYNRKAYDIKIEEALANLERYNVPSTLLVCDIDHFKQVNDRFGHHTGDLALKKVAQIFKVKFRKNDFVARYGGEEFIFILPYTTLKEAVTVAEEVRSFIEKATFTFKENKVPLTISAGVSILRKGDDALTIFERADVALYMAKNSGRNMVKTEEDVEIAGKTFSDFLIDR